MIKQWSYGVVLYPTVKILSLISRKSVKEWLTHTRCIVFSFKVSYKKKPPIFIFSVKMAQHFSIYMYYDNLIISKHSLKVI